MAPVKTKDRKVRVSFTNWVLGGSLVSLSSTDSETGHRRVSGRQVKVVNETDSDGEDVIVKHVDHPEIDKAKSKDGEGGAKKDEKKKDKVTEKYKNGCCKSCGKDKDSEESKKEDGERSKKDGGQKSKNDDQVKAKKDDGDKSKDSGDGEKKSDVFRDKSGGGDDGWTDEQTSKLKEMKAPGRKSTWKEIAAELGHNQGDCKKKFKEIENSGGTKTNSGDASKDKEDDKPAEVINIGSFAGGGGNGWVTVENGDDFDPAAIFAEPASPPKKSNNGNDGGKKGKGKNKGNGDNQKQNQANDVPQSPTHAQTFGGSGWAGSGNANDWQQKDSNNAGGNYFGKSPEVNKATPVQAAPEWHRWENPVRSPQQRFSPKQNQGQNFNQNQNYNQGFNQSFDQNQNQNQPLKCLRPDDTFSQKDCEVLEYLMDRYKEHRWLEIKAGFFNWTQKMISDEVIKKKFQDDGWL